MTQRRRFSARERTALYLAADGRCQECGRELEPGWHADHERPYSRGGSTDVANGQALCPSCNLKKGSRVKELRDWQREALRRWNANRQDFLAVATPAAGKTAFALAAARAMLDAGEVDRIIVVVPFAHLRRQWAQAAERIGMHLDSRFANGVGALARDYHGVVITYATVASEPQLWRKLTSSARTLIVFDEVHHAGDREHLSWGPALRVAFEPAVRRLLLSGTPFRSDGAPIPFVRYDENGRCIASMEYGYREALQDRIVRPIEFPVLDGTMKWRLNKTELEIELSKADDATMAAALTVAIDPDGIWMPSVLARADEELTRARETMPDAGGLVIAADMQLAKRYATILRGITNESPIVATSDDPEASDKIERFAWARSRWIVAVAMVSEGVDIPRLAVGVYASRYRTEMFFRQVVGRFVRMRGLDDETYASLLIPAIEPLVRFAREIEEISSQVLREQSEPVEREAPEDREPALFEVVESSEVEHTSTVLGGQAPTDAEMRHAREMMKAAGVTSGLSVATAALLLRAAGTAPTVEMPSVVMPQQAKPPTRADEKHRLRQRIKRLVGQYTKKTGSEYSHVHKTLNDHFNEKSIEAATIETLQGRIHVLERWVMGG